MTCRLGRVEALVLLLTALLGEDREYNLVRRSEVTRAAMNCLAKTGRLHVSYASMKASLSRAVYSLCEKGLLRGYYRPWYEYRGWHGSAEVFCGVGSRPFAGFDDARAKQRRYVRPRLIYLKATDEGCEALTCEKVNAWVDALGWRGEGMVDFALPATRDRRGGFARAVSVKKFQALRPDGWRNPCP